MKGRRDGCGWSMTDHAPTAGCFRMKWGSWNSCSWSASVMSSYENMHCAYPSLRICISVDEAVSAEQERITDSSTATRVEMPTCRCIFRIKNAYTTTRTVSWIILNLRAPHFRIKVESEMKNLPNTVHSCSRHLVRERARLWASGNFTKRPWNFVIELVFENKLFLRACIDAETEYWK